ncbi:UDP-glucuronosyl/UDP-glucosyltransferase, partial [Parasponia andersonii]
AYCPHDPNCRHGQNQTICFSKLRSYHILTPANSYLFRRNPGLEIEILLKICENVHLIATHEMAMEFFESTTMLEQPFEQLVRENHPSFGCLVTNMFFPWTTRVAAKYAIPRLVFHGTNSFGLCTSVCLTKYVPHKVSSELESFLRPNEVKYDCI